MKIMEIDKAVYRKNINRVIVFFVGSLAVLSLAFGAVLIAVFGAETVDPSGSTGNFHLNLIGVVLAAIVCASVLSRLKDKPYLKEIYYVWQLKQLHNKIYRKLTKIKNRAELHDVNALIILKFYYSSLKQVYLLDNNSLTLPTLEKDIIKLDSQIISQNLTISTDQFEADLLNKIV
ncbi:DUF3087 domain-containing protein [Photobacterium indicum]|uniref:DUF3087 domain-containing protein n=1 Tax=Photobacterium indicum TaxID=81447 RepID=UPI003D0BA42C